MNAITCRQELTSQNQPGLNELRKLLRHAILKGDKEAFDKVAILLLEDQNHRSRSLHICYQIVAFLNKGGQRDVGNGRAHGVEMLEIAAMYTNHEDIREKLSDRIYGVMVGPQRGDRYTSDRAVRLLTIIAKNRHNKSAAADQTPWDVGISFQESMIETAAAHRRAYPRDNGTKWAWGRYPHQIKPVL